MTDKRKDCLMRHENGNCNVIGGFCTAVNDPICAGLHNAYDCGYFDGVTRAKRQKEHPQWISAKDRLPDRTMPPHDVLVCHDLNCGMFIDRAWYSHEKNKWRSAVGMNLKVTHWMPLPEPPEEGTE